MNTHSPKSPKSPKSSILVTLTFNWVVLLLLTLAAVVLSQQSIAAQTLTLFALVITVFKSQIVVDRFMGLRHIDIRWRGLMLAYIIIITAIILLIYSSAPSI